MHTGGVAGQRADQFPAGRVPDPDRSGYAGREVRAARDGQLAAVTAKGHTTNVLGGPARRPQLEVAQAIEEVPLEAPQVG